MAEKGIKGITISIDGDTSPLKKALSSVNSESKKLTDELKGVEKLLKFNPGNAQLVGQKMEILGQSVEKTSKKLDMLKQAQAEVERQFKANDITVEQYRDFQRELVATEGALNGLQAKMKGVAEEEKTVADTMKKLETLFKVTGTSVDDFADSLGSKLVKGIKNGTATSKQLEDALNKIGKSALGANVDLDKMKNALKNVDSNGIKNVKKELHNLAKEANDTKGNVSDLDGVLSGLGGGLVAAGGLQGILDASLTSTSLTTSVALNFDLDEESMASVKTVISNITNYGIDSETALEGVRRQFALNAETSDEVNARIIEGAAAITRAYSGVDFSELIQEANEIAGELEISDEAALGLVDSLLKAGFPPEQLDIIAEYGRQLNEAGFSAEEIQQIMSEAVISDSWNIDNLLDGLGEGRKLMSEFGQGLDKATAALLDNIGLSEKEFVQWGKDIAAGGDAGRDAMIKVAKQLDKMEEGTNKNALGVAVFGTMWEEQGESITDSILGAEDATYKLQDGIDGINKKTETIESDPMFQLKSAFTELNETLGPVYEKIAEVVTKFSDFVKENPQLSAAIAIISSAFGILMGLFNFLAPVIGLVVKNFGLIRTAFTLLTGPVGIVISIIMLLITVLVRNWDEAVQLFKDVTESVGTFFKDVWTGIKEFFTVTLVEMVDKGKEKFEEMSKKISDKVTEIKESITEKFEDAKSKATKIFEDIKDAVWKPIEEAKKKVDKIVSEIKGFFDNLELKLPEIKMPKRPKLKIKGEFSWEKKTVPSLSVDWVNWFASGGVFDTASIIGVGERGREAVIPLTGDAMKPFAEAIASVMPSSSQQTGDITNNFNIDQIVIREEADIQKVAQQLAREQEKVSRAGGRVSYA